MPTYIFSGSNLRATARIMDSQQNRNFFIKIIFNPLHRLLRLFEAGIIDKITDDEYQDLVSQVQISSVRIFSGIDTS